MARALDRAARQWPGESRSPLLLRLVHAGSPALEGAHTEAARDRRHAIDATSGKYTDAFSVHHLASTLARGVSPSTRRSRRHARHRAGQTTAPRCGASPGDRTDLIITTRRTHPRGDTMTFKLALLWRRDAGLLGPLREPRARPAARLRRETHATPSTASPRSPPRCCEPSRTRSSSSPRLMVSLRRRPSSAPATGPTSLQLAARQSPDRRLRWTSRGSSGQGVVGRGQRLTSRLGQVPERQGHHARPAAKRPGRSGGLVHPVAMS